MAVPQTTRWHLNANYAWAALRLEQSIAQASKPAKEEFYVAAIAKVDDRRGPRGNAMYNDPSGSFC